MDGSGKPGLARLNWTEAQWCTRKSGSNSRYWTVHKRRTDKSFLLSFLTEHYEQVEQKLWKALLRKHSKWTILHYGQNISKFILYTVKFFCFAEQFNSEEKTFLLFQNIIKNYKMFLLNSILIRVFKEYSTCNVY